MQTHLMPFIIALLALLIAGQSNIANAHLAGVTDTHIELRKSIVKVVFTVPKDDLRMVPQHSTISDGISIINAKKACKARVTGSQSLDNIDSQQFFIDYHCPQELSNLQIHYSLLINEIAGHENHVRLSIAGHLQQFSFSKNNTSHAIPVDYLLMQWQTELLSNNAADTSKISDRDKLAASTVYFGIGIEHILLGWDHVLFLLCLLLLPVKLAQLFALVTSFTVAHSITLALSVFDIITLPALIVEALIALSIVYIAAHNIWRLRNRPSLDHLSYPLKSQVTTTFIFGLIHGFGFSYILKEIGLGEQASAALLFFNIGVEAGQLLIVAIAFPLITWASKKTHTAHLPQAISCGIGAIGLFWLIQRTGLTQIFTLL